MKVSEFKRKVLTKNGCHKDHDGAGHEIWRNPKTGKTAPVSRHPSEELKTGTMNAILKELGLK